MTGFKLTCWNVEHADKTLSELDGTAKPKRGESVAAMQARARQKIDAIGQEIREIDADILFVCEGPKGEGRATEYFRQAAPGYDLVIRPGQDDKSYATEGTQWLWFLVKKGFGPDVFLLPIQTWQSFTREQTAGATDAGKWLVSSPGFDSRTLLPLPNSLKPHDHYRHPQVLVFEWAGKRVEVIGVHLKSKLVKGPGRNWVKPASASFADIRASVEASTGYMASAVEARSKLSTEVTDVRNYIDRRYQQETHPAIFVLGDVNDGPGKELIEEWFMLHDLIGNLQGDVFFADRFLNHALFDYAGRLRWTVRFKDEIDPRRDPHVLIDHIVFTQTLSGSAARPLRVMPGAGKVEHDIHERIASLLPRGVTTSDHRPVSVFVSDTTSP